MRFYNNLKMKDLFQNPKLAHVLPQFEESDKLQNVQSFEWINDKVRDYLSNALGAEISGNDLKMQGNKSDVLKQLQSLKWTIEAFFNSMPGIVKNLRKNTAVYLPFSSVEQISNLKTNEQKIQLFNVVLDNLVYNPDFMDMNDKNIDIHKSGVPYAKRQAMWAEQVGLYRRKLW